MSNSLKGLHKSHKQAAVEQRAGINIFKLTSNKPPFDPCVSMTVQQDLLSAQNALANLVKEAPRICN